MSKKTNSTRQSQLEIGLLKTEVRINLHLLTNTCTQQMGQKGQFASDYCEWGVKCKIYGEQKD